MPDHERPMLADPAPAGGGETHGSGQWYSRWLFERALALIYFTAFLVAVNQFVPLLGEQGLLPVPEWVRQVPFRASPSLFYLFPTDTAFRTAAWLGVMLSVVALTGLASRAGSAVTAAVWALLWLLYLSFVNVGQTFYGFGWETLLLETGFLAIFLGGRTTEPSVVITWLLRWLLFRLMFGAGLIKWRGDPCWLDLTCLDYYFETQPMPNPLTWYFHWLPAFVHRAGVIINHIVEIGVPFLYFAPQPFAAAAGLVTIAFQLILIVSGNLSWLNWLTIVLAIATFTTAGSPGSRCAVLGCERRRLRAGRLCTSSRWSRPPQRPANAEHALARAGDEHVVRAAAPREHVWGLRLDHEGASRNRD